MLVSEQDAYTNSATAVNHASYIVVKDIFDAAQVLLRYHPWVKVQTKMLKILTEVSLHMLAHMSCGMRCRLSFHIPVPYIWSCD